jgi:hypothetical protein
MQNFGELKLTRLGKYDVSSKTVKRMMQEQVLQW